MSERLRVVSLNLASGRSATGELVTPAALRRVVADLDADVLAAQEVDRGQPRSGGRDLAAEVAEAMCAVDHCFVPTLIGTPGGQWHAADGTESVQEPAYGVALFSRRPVRTWTVTRMRSPRLYAPVVVPTERGLRLLPVKEEPRALILADLDGVTIGATHLAFVPGWNVQQLRRCLALAAARPGPRLLLGDLNLPGRVVDVVTRWTRLVDAPTWPSARPQVQFDHVLSDGWAGRVLEATAVAVEVSDHRAVVVDLLR